MAFTPIQEKKGKNYLISLGIIIAILICLAIIWIVFFSKAKEAPSPVIFEPKEIKINFEILKNPALEKLQLFEYIKPTEEEIGRENPFIPY